MEPVARFGMWVFLVTDAMSFGALLGVYAFERARADAWPDVAARVNLPLGVAATLVLVASSLTLARKKRLATLALGVAFVGAQLFEYATLARHGVGFDADAAASIFFATTGWHALHVVAGVIALACARRAD
ncbi:MAG: cytochrome c oxidase subunit 3, partial [Myxococcales bacterium]|nr:cytochrome c oxidase subunit 3 [Myxococcales bacterium]